MGKFILLFLAVISSQLYSQSADTLLVKSGWNLIGGLQNGTPSQVVITIPANITISPYYAFDPVEGYVPEDTLKRGIGYWIKCSQDGMMVIGSAPAAPVPASPANGSTNINLSATLSWNPVSGADSYTLQVSIDDQFTSFAYNQSGLTVTSIGLTGLDYLTQYYWRVNAENNYGTSGWSAVWSFTTSPMFLCGVSQVNHSGKMYNTVQIGSQCWLKENLNVGTMIEGTQNPTNNGVMEKYCFANDTANCNTYGGLYQWDELMQYTSTAGSQGICPAGWHIPTYEEFFTLSAATAWNGNTLKAVGQGSGGGAGTNTTGFSALLAGYRSTTGGLLSLGSFGYFWSSTEEQSTYAYLLGLNTTNSIISLYYDYKTYGFSARCIQD